MPWIDLNARYGDDPTKACVGLLASLAPAAIAGGWAHERWWDAPGDLRMNAGARRQQTEELPRPTVPPGGDRNTQGEFLRILADFYVGKASQSDLTRALEQLGAANP
jgi:hypothetical protein